MQAIVICWTWSLAVLGAGAAASGPAASRPAAASQPAADAVVLSSGDAAVDAILDRLESKGKAIRDLRAKVKKDQIDTFPVKEVRTNEGVLLFRRFDANPKFLIRFDRYVAAGIVREGPENREWFVFDGQWLIERQDKAKIIHKRQVLAAGEHLDVFKLGQGPFPMPIGQSRRDMLTHFSITRGAAAGKDDPAGCDHLVCAVRKGSDLAETYKTVEFFVDRALDLPVRIRAERAKDETVVVVTLIDVKLNTGMAASEFEIPLPKDYQLTVDPLPKVGEGAGRVPVIQP